MAFRTRPTDVQPSSVRAPSFTKRRPRVRHTRGEKADIRAFPERVFLGLQIAFEGVATRRMGRDVGFWAQGSYRASLILSCRIRAQSLAGPRLYSADVLPTAVPQASHQVGSVKPTVLVTSPVCPLPSLHSTHDAMVRTRIQKALDKVKAIR